MSVLPRMRFRYPNCKQPINAAVVGALGGRWGVING